MPSFHCPFSSHLMILVNLAYQAFLFFIIFYNKHMLSILPSIIMHDIHTLGYESAIILHEEGKLLAMISVCQVTLNLTFSASIL